MPKNAPAPAIGTEWTHVKTGKGYKVIDSGFNTKDADSGRWHTGVMYELTNSDGQRYVRQLDNFLAKFQPVAPTTETK